MSLRVYFYVSGQKKNNLRSLKVGKSPNGLAYFVEINIDGVKVQQRIDEDSGRFYLTTDSFGHIPAEIQGRVIEVGRVERFEGRSHHKRVIKPAYYSVENGGFRAEALEEIVNGTLGVVVRATAKSVSLMTGYWPLLLSGKLTPKHDYTG